MSRIAGKSRSLDCIAVDSMYTAGESSFGEIQLSQVCMFDDIPIPLH